MRELLIIILAILTSNTCIGQTHEVENNAKKIEGFCNQNELYLLMSELGGQTEPVSPVSISQIYDRLVREINLDNDFPKVKESKVVAIYINCQGKVVNVESEFKNEKLNQRIYDIFNSLGVWKAGIKEGNPVDSTVLYHFKIKKGKLILNGNIWRN
ncbi:hypothetical protein ACFQ0I_11685 [Mariniflexile aquimaris]|uniref:TonB-like protein n=1 Tax=Mariniflexile aquimaris TaxID=881009 RepID=A0ABW3BU34_9FLAO